MVSFGVVLKCLFLIGVSICLSSPAFAQVMGGGDSAIVRKKAKIKRKDIFDVFKSLKRSSNLPTDSSADEFKLVDDSATGTIFTVLPYLNYSLVTSLAMGSIANTTFYLGKAKNTDLSLVDLMGNYTLNKQLILRLRSIIWQRSNKYVFWGDWRYLKYPSYTYGLGPDAPEENKVLLDYSYLRVYQSIFRKILPRLYFGMGYRLDYHFNIAESNGGRITDYQVYAPTENKQESVSSGVSWNMLYDTRKNSINPVPGGYYALVGYRLNSKSLKSTGNWQTLIVDMRKYIRFPSYTSNVIAIWSFNWLTFGGDAPYLDLPSTGWDNNDNQGRGYLQGRFRGHNLISLEAEYRFSITENKLLGGVVFSNVQSFSDGRQPEFNVFYPAVGAGLRLKFNKHTNTNLSVDYGMGLNGAKSLFFNLGEVF